MRLYVFTARDVLVWGFWVVMHTKISTNVRVSNLIQLALSMGRKHYAEGKKISPRGVTARKTSKTLKTIEL
jgi:hypothetical protein